VTGRSIGDVNVTLEREPAHQPEDLTRLFVERANEGDAEGMALLYEVDAIMAFPLGQQTVGRANIAGLFEKMVASRPHFGLEEPLPTLILGDLALTSTPALDAAGARAQVARRQPDGTWLRVLDRPDFRV
jgi:ketosteroid isomerase-like protein